MQKYINSEEVMAMTGLTKKDINQLVRSRKFPSPNTLGKYPVWSAREIDLWNRNIWKR